MKAEQIAELVGSDQGSVRAVLSQMRLDGEAVVISGGLWAAAKPANEADWESLLDDEGESGPDQEAAAPWGKGLQYVTVRLPLPLAALFFTAPEPGTHWDAKVRTVIAMGGVIDALWPDAEEH